MNRKLPKQNSRRSCTFRKPEGSFFISISIYKCISVVCTFHVVLLFYIYDIWWWGWAVRWRLRIPAPPPSLPLSYPHSLVKTFQSHHVTGVVVVVIYVKEWPDLATTCVCEQAKDTFFFFSFFPSFKKVSHIVRVRCQQSYCVYHSTYSFFFILSNPPSLFWSVGRAIGFRWWMVREEAQHRQVTLLFSYILTGREERHTRSFFPP